MKTILVTGVAGFIGFHVAKRALNEGFEVVGIDSLSDYYDVKLKQDRLAQLTAQDGFTFVHDKVEGDGVLMKLFADHRPTHVVHLAAQAGVRYSIDAPRSYMEANLVGTFELLEAARAHPPQHMLLASTSSAYGANTKMPYGETDKTSHQMSFYAATKKATEAMAHSYAHLYDLPTTMFRFFTVYGPWGRPDMAPYKFTRAISADEPIDVYNHGDMRRDFTFIDDLVEALMRLLDVAPVRPEGDPDESDSLSPVAPWRVLNIGNAAPVELMDFIAAIEKATGKRAQMNMKPMQPGDVPATWADTQLLQKLTGYVPATPIEAGMARFVAWFNDYYKT